ncbi:hypothetical protein AAG906_034324 [Vitis piasezkii]
MEMGDQYGLPDLRQFMARPSHFPAVPHPTEPYLHHYEAIMVGSHMGEVVVPRGLVDFHGDSATATATPTATATAAATAASVVGVGGLEMECGGVGGDGGNSRWPRQETLTLLEIRSRLDPKFKEANQKGPLWAEVSRIMAEEHGYQRSGKKCREKFENLYKYYKKTKEGKAGRQDGKHYRFFRQLEALYGETSNQASVSETHLAGNTTLLYQTTNNTTINQANQEALQDHKFCESHSFSNSSEFETSSSENNDDDLSAIAYMMNHSMEKKRGVDDGQSYRRVRKSLKGKIKEFVGLHMKKIMDTQEAWMEKMLTTIEHKEQERLSREEEWRKQEAARFDREYKFWASERAWIEARDAALMEALKKFTGKELKLSSPDGLMDKEIQDQNESMEDIVNEVPDDTTYSRWPEQELSSLIHLRTSMESRFQDSGYSEESLWEEIATRMGCLGYERSAMRCKQKWENINIYLNKTTEHSKKRKENLRTCTYFQPLDSYHGQEIMAKQGSENVGLQKNSEDHLSPSNSSVGTTVHGSCLNILLDEEHLWEDYGVKPSMGKNQQVWHK